MVLQISDVTREKAIEEESRSILPPLMEADSDESESLRKVITQSGHYHRVRKLLVSVFQHRPSTMCAATSTDWRQANLQLINIIMCEGNDTVVNSDLKYLSSKLL